MSGFSIALLLANLVGILALPRRWAPLPLLIGACYVTRSQLIELGPFHFSVIRILILAGLVRIIIRGETLAGRMNAVDSMMLVWSVWMLLSSSFHENPSAALIFRLGLAYDACGIYFLVRAFCLSREDVLGLCQLTAILLVPVAVEMIYEKMTVNNLFFSLGGTPIALYIREGHIRAQGPFNHAIIAGTVGAVSLPLIVPLWQKHRKTALVGFGACIVIIFTCASSGPLISLIAGIGALFMWRHREQVRLLRWLAVAVYIGLDLVMRDPAYFILARIDLVGGSTGWHRARLIQSAFEHLSEWWLAGTDYTRHWMPSGVTWSPDHTDITNHYLQMGVTGGLPLMLLFIVTLGKGFSLVGLMAGRTGDLSPPSRFMCWALGSSLFAHATTFISVSYFDQSFVFIYLTLAAIASVYSRDVMKSHSKVAISRIRIQERGLLRRSA